MNNDMHSNIQFIKLIKERPCLYDYNREDYCDKYAQEAAWLDIARKVNKTVAVCKERWKNLRGCYTRHLKKNKRSPDSSKKHVKPYYLADHLQFLYSFTKTRPPKYTFKEEHNTEIGLELPNDISNDSDNSGEFEEKHPRSPSPTNIIMGDVNATAMECFQSRQDNQDPDLAFLYSLLPDVKDMNREQKRKFKVGVLKLAGDILQDTLASPASRNSDS